MVFKDGEVLATLPHQPPAGKLDYSVVLRSDRDSAVLPREGGVVIRFKGDVPLWILIPHVIVIFGAMLLSTRTGLEYFRTPENLQGLAVWTLGFTVVGGLVLGPLVQWYAFGAFWTGWPFGHDLTDNKTLLAAIGWGVAVLAIRRSRRPAAWAFGAALLMLVVFLIPHSVLGSELDYRALDAARHP
jgi:FtsH-binding integral membrane protein